MLTTTTATTTIIYIYIKLLTQCLYMIYVYIYISRLSLSTVYKTTLFLEILIKKILWSAGVVEYFQKTMQHVFGLWTITTKIFKSFWPSKFELCDRLPIHCLWNHPIFRDSHWKDSMDSGGGRILPKNLTAHLRTMNCHYINFQVILTFQIWVIR